MDILQVGRVQNGLIVSTVPVPPAQENVRVFQDALEAAEYAASLIVGVPVQVHVIPGAAPDTFHVEQGGQQQ